MIPTIHQQFPPLGHRLKSPRKFQFQKLKQIKKNNNNNWRDREEKGRTFVLDGLALGRWGSLSDGATDEDDEFLDA